MNFYFFKRLITVVDAVPKLRTFLWKKKANDLGGSKRERYGHKRMLNRMAALCNFRLRNLKMDHCYKGEVGVALELLEQTHTAQPRCTVVSGMNEVPEGLVAMA